jgi:hypothetical protein
MPDYSLVPVDYQPDFDDYSLVPVDYDPFAADGVTQHAQIQQAQAQPQQQPAASPPNAGARAIGDGPSGSGGYGGSPTGVAPNSDGGAVKAAPSGGYTNPMPMDTLGGGPEPLYDENHMVDSYVYKKYPLALYQQALRLLQPRVIARSPPLMAPNTRISVGFMDIRLRTQNPTPTI